jgi:dsRNA-specific ribonuclease
MTSDTKLDDDIIRTEDGLIFNPYNPLNTEITLSDVQSILTRYGLPTKVNNIEFYRRAFIHRSYTKRPQLENLQQNITIADRPQDCLPLSSKSNERLEYIGDGVLELTTKYELYRRFPKEDEGFMTEKKIAIVKNENIGKIAYEMGLHKWLIISRNAEEKKIRTNLKKLGCLFEAFVGALFHDYNKMGIKDEDGWFTNFFSCGPGFQMAQKFIENVFKKHVNWIELIQNDDNYKNILQVKIQKEFKVTPHYVEIEHEIDDGYKMGVYLCLGQQIHNAKIHDAIKITDIKTFKAIQEHYTRHGKIFVFMGEGQHKIKRKAEQMACMEAIDFIKLHNDISVIVSVNETNVIDANNYDNDDSE